MSICSNARYRDAGILVALLAFAFGLRMLAWGLLPNVYREDEVFQTLEPAHSLYSGFGVVTWEWREGIRSWLFPGALAALMWGSRELLGGRASYLPVIAAALSVLSLTNVAGAFAVGRRQFGAVGGLLCGAVAACWPDLVYFDPKPLTEVAAGQFLVAGVFLAELWRGRVAGRHERAACLATGLLLGTSCALRFQYAPALVVVLALTGRGGNRRWLPLLAAAAMPILLAGLLDFATWGSPFQSVWKNYASNVLAGRSLTYGVASPFYYVLQFARIWGAALLPIAFAWAVGVSTLPIAGTTALAMMLVHSLFGHKNFSFIYPAIPLVLCVSCIGSLELLRRLQPARDRMPRPGVASGALLACWLATCLLVGMSGDFPSRWRNKSDFLAEMSGLRAWNGEMCGLAVYDGQWPSYALFDRPVPVKLVRTEQQLALVRPAVSHVLLRRERIPAAQPASIEQCWNEMCLLRLDHSECLPEGEYAINAVLAREGF
jgi:hypothetical protein